MKVRMNDGVEDFSNEGEASRCFREEKDSKNSKILVELENHAFRPSPICKLARNVSRGTRVVWVFSAKKKA
jgi:hypothetical protein